LTHIRLGFDSSLKKTIPIKCLRFEQAKNKYYRLNEPNMKGTKVK